MPQFRGDRNAFGAPGADPRWSPAAKQGVGTASSLASRIWFTIWNGILTEIFYPNVDQPQMRDAQFIFTDGDRLFLDEKQDLEHEMATIDGAQGYRIHSRDREGRFSCVKEIIADPRRASILIRTELKGDDPFLEKLRVYLLCAPHLEVGGHANNAYVIEVAGRELLVAEKKGRWMVAAASCPFVKLSCGYVGQSDGYTDLRANGRMTLEFDKAENGNVALTGELAVRNIRAFTVVIGFGETMPSATSTVLQSLGTDYQNQRRIFVQLWRDAVGGRMALEKASCDQGALYHSSYNVVLTHEDKIYQGAFVASLTTPWGEVRSDKSKGGYHIVWTRDMVQSALGLLAAGNREAPVRVLIYLMARQEEDGGFAQNFWVDGEPFRRGNQLDEVAFPVLLAWRLKQEGLLENFDARVMVRRATNFLLLSGPVTGEERWEETGGYSPSTLAAVIAAFICGAGFERDSGHEETASFLEAYADFLLAHVKDWTVTTEGYFVRINPAKPGEVAYRGDVDRAMVTLSSQPPGQPDSFPARDIVDAGFLQLVRYGILAPDDPLVVRSLQVTDAKLKTTTLPGDCWRRYTNDGYGQRPDGGPFEKWGKGRSWPLLTGERAHYELAAGHDCSDLVEAMEKFSGTSHLLPEQIWDEADLPEAGMRGGGPTGSAVPLVWAHSEYLRLLRSRRDGKVFDLIPEVVERYGKGQPQATIEFWLPKHPMARVRSNSSLRICAPKPFHLRWTSDNWVTWQDTGSSTSGVGAEFVDVPGSAVSAGVEFTFFWKESGEWGGRNYRVEAET